MYFNTELAEDQADQRDEVDYYAPRTKSKYTEVETIGYCPTCSKRLTNIDDIYVSSFDMFCSEACIEKFLEDEANEQN